MWQFIFRGITIYTFQPNKQQQSHHQQQISRFCYFPFVGSFYQMRHLVECTRGFYFVYLRNKLTAQETANSTIVFRHHCHGHHQ
jgi:hypothetical protein